VNSLQLAALVQLVSSGFITEWETQTLSDAVEEAGIVDGGQAFEVLLSCWRESVVNFIS
jgi:hypothetical protein